MTRAARQLWWMIKHPSLLWLRRSWRLPRPSYCACCGMWAWTTEEQAAASTAKAFICDECADENDREWNYVWSNYYAERL